MMTPMRLNSRCATAARFAFRWSGIDAMRPVAVVPIFAPRMIPIAWSKVSRPVETSITTSPETTLDDCTTAVTTRPASIATQMFDIEPSRLMRSGFSRIGSINSNRTASEKNTNPK